jgi:murein DD-endopeptidase MepM/ murein hydrolase activator NlpD
MGSLYRPDSGLLTRRGRSRRPQGWRGSMRLGALFAVLVGINIYVFFFRGGTSIKDVLKTGAISAKSAAATKTSRPDPRQAQAAQKTASAPDDSVVVQGTMKGHLGLGPALTASKLDPVQVKELLASLNGSLNMRALRADHSYEARLDPRDGKVRSFVYRTSPISAVEVVRGTNGALKVNKREAALTTKTVRVGGKIESSLGAAISSSGESSALVAMFVDLFSWDINWYADPRDGDEFRIVVEKQFLGDKFYRYGHILAAEYRGKVGRFQAYYFKPQTSNPGYFVPEGRALRREFLKTPLHFRRLSSKFNLKRFHPVLHTTKGHFGVDYAAPTGTPVWAAADGKVMTAAKSGGGGNMVVLAHAANVSTMYMHLSRFAKGLHAGDKVKQRQVIGYVGCTGLCTGPHLHYGVKVRGKYIDPMSFNPRKGDMLARAERIRFLDQLPGRMSELEGIPVSPATAASKTDPKADSEEE